MANPHPGYAIQKPDISDAIKKGRAKGIATISNAFRETTDFMPVRHAGSGFLGTFSEREYPYPY